MASSLVSNFIFNQKTLYQLAAAFIVYLLVKAAFFLRVRRKRYKLFDYYGIPGPKPNLFDGNFSSYLQDPALFKTDAKFRAKYGKTFGMFIADEPNLITTDLNVLRTVFIDNPSLFRDRVRLFIEDPTTRGILFAPHHRWEFFRRIMSPSFSSYKVRGDTSLQFVENSIKSMLDYIENKLSICQSDEVDLDVNGLFKSITLQVISHMAINLPQTQVGEREKYVASLDDFLDKASEGAEHVVIRFPFLRGIMQYIANNFEYGLALKLISSSLKASIDKHVKLLQAYAEGRASKPKDASLLDTLIRLYHEGKLTRQEVTANCLGLLIAGYDTTATTLTYIFWAIAKHQSVQSRLRAELMTHGTESIFLDNVIDESMRLWPVATNFISRIAGQTVQINSKLIIPQGTRVIYNSWLLHRDEKIWGADALEFKPERFAREPDRHPCAYAPFGLGQRRCIGWQLARLEMKMIICDILLRYSIKLDSPEHLDCISTAVFLSKPKDKVILRIARVKA